MIVDSRLSTSSPEAQRSCFRSIVRHHVAHRIHLAAAKTGQVLHLNGKLPELPQSLFLELTEPRRMKARATLPPQVTRQQVKAVLVKYALYALLPMTLAELCQQTGARYQTASAAVTEMLQLHIVAGEREGPIHL